MFWRNRTLSGNKIKDKGKKVYENKLWNRYYRN